MRIVSDPVPAGSDNPFDPDPENFCQAIKKDIDNRYDQQGQKSTGCQPSDHGPRPLP